MTSTRARLPAAGLPLLAGGLGLAAAGLPLALPFPMPLTAGLAVALLLATAAALSVARDLGRTLCVVALVLWVALRLVPGDGPGTAVALASGVLIRLLAGLPELARLGRAAWGETVVEVIGGAAAAGVVVTVARGGDRLPSPALVVAAVGGLLLGAAVVRRVRGQVPR